MVKLAVDTSIFGTLLLDEPFETENDAYERANEIVNDGLTTEIDGLGLAIIPHQQIVKIGFVAE